MRVLRTPDERFENLAGFRFEPHYLEIDDGVGGRLRMHYVDEGPRDGPLVLCLHGQPVWSYSFRKMVPLLAEAGHRVIAPDLVGFGRSDKPAERSDYTYARHVHWMQEFILDLDLTEITFVIHDWGGLIGLRVLTQNLERFDRVVACNMGLHDLKDVPMEQGPALRKLLEETPALSAEEMIRTGEETTRRMMAASDSEGGTKRSVFFRVFMYWVRHCGAFAGFRPEEIVRRWLKNPTDEDTRAYAAPFPSEEYLQGARQFPSLVPIFPDDPAIPDNRRAWEILRTFEKPFLTAFNNPNSIEAPRFQQEIPGARGQNHVVFENSGHYPQDDVGEEFARVVIEFARTRTI